MVSSFSIPAKLAPGIQLDVCALLHLPEELFFQMLQECTIPAILAIRQCCTLTYQYTKDRSVWMHQLSSFLTDMKMEPCGVVPDINGISSSDLELLVSRHLKARSHAWKNRGGSLPYTKWRVSELDNIESVLMIRGGRFLVGCSKEALFFWDIGFQIGCPAERERLVCSTPINLPPGYKSYSTYIWEFRIVDPMLYVSIWISGNWGSTPYLCVYKMDLSAERKEFYTVSQLVLPAGFYAGSVDDKKFTIYRTSPPALGVHYYEPSTTITWDAELPSYFCIIDTMRDFAFVEVESSTTNVSALNVWELPIPSRFSTQPTQHLTDYKPFRTWNLPTGFVSNVSSIVSWDEGFQDAIYFDRFKCDEEAITILRLSFKAEHSEFENCMEPAFRIGPSIMFPRSTLGEFREDEVVKFCTFADGMRVLYWSVKERLSDAKLVMHFSNANDEFPPFHVNVGSQVPALGHWLKHSVMVSIGRICVLDEGKVEIWELC
ncbi:hypothetical protein DL96DRAFT_1580856 [Flagelloscypha sp. PMI_526]|nr:hypothetical protein DL96DRAFT_1580856 [Flagelloscypha sp. PMI_526]